MEPLPGEEVELQDLSRPEEQVDDNEEWETPFEWSPEFDRFMEGGPRQYFGVDPLENS